MQPVTQGSCRLTYWELLYLMPRYFSWIHHRAVVSELFLITSDLKTFHTSLSLHYFPLLFY
jgi:hypothetical protein